MLFNWKLKGLEILHLGPSNEVLSSESTFRSGSFLISNLARKFNLKHSTDLKTEPSAIQMQVESDSFSISIPSEFKVKSVDSNEIWAGSEAGPLRTAFTWNQIPPELSVCLPNQTKISVRKKVVDAFSKESPLRFSIPIVGALLVHIVSTIFVSLPSSTPERKPLKVSVDLIQPFAAQNNAQAPPDGDAVTTLREAKQLFKSLRVKKNKIPTPSFKNIPLSKLNAFTESKSAFNKTWSIDQEMMKGDETPLNLTEAQVKAALQPAYGKLKECYEDVLIHDSSIKGQPQLRIDVSHAGKISSVNLSYLNARPESLRQLSACFLRAYQNIRVPNPNRDFQVVHTLVLDY